VGTGALAILAAAVCVMAHREPRFPGDLRVTLWFQSADSQVLTSAMEWVSRLSGEWPALALVIVGTIVVWRRLGRPEACLVLAMGATLPAYSILKVIVNRPRPSADLVQVFVTEKGSGFPSGHAFFAMAFLGLVIWLALTHAGKRSLSAVVLAGCLLLILMIGASRVYLGVHWLSDVLGGYLLGTVFLALLLWMYHWWRVAPRSS
jgi:membrane-associated phospholipid phosphatase